MIGLGTQDSYAQAKAFVVQHGITFRMFWDDDFDSWEGFGIQRQPASILVSRQGTKLKRWQGELSESEREEAVRLAREKG